MLSYMLYKSSATNPMADEDLDELLTVSRTNNEKWGITGILIYYEGNFIQLIEGEPDRIQTLFNTISADPRHKDIQVLAEGQIEQTMFPDWKMGYKKVLLNQEAEIPGFIDFWTAVVEAQANATSRNARANLAAFLKTVR